MLDGWEGKEGEWMKVVIDREIDRRGRGTKRE